MRALRRHIASHPGLVSLLVYLATTLFWFRAAVGHLGSACACYLPGDPSQYAWAYGWSAHALTSGQSLVYSHAMWSPSGINLPATGASMPILGIVMAPVTLLWSPIVTYHVVAIAAPVTGAWAAFWLCLYITRSPWASLVGGGTYGFCSYEIAQLSGHPNLYLVFCPPLAVLCVLAFFRGSIGRRWFVAALGATVAIQLMLAPELAFTMGVLGVVTIALASVLADRQSRRRILAMIPWIVASGMVAGAVSSWYLYEFTRGTPIATDVGKLYPTDLLSFLTPMPYSWIFGSTFQNVTAKYVAGAGETDAYIGLPLFLIVVWYLATRWRLWTTKLLGGLLVVVILWILGGQLYVLGKRTIWLPYALLRSLPGFDEVMQGRVALYLALICAVILAMWLSTPRRRPALSWAGGLLALALILPNFADVGIGYTGTWENPSFYRTDVYKHYINKGATVMPIPWSWHSESLMWQAEDGMYYNLAGGYMLHSPPRSWQGVLAQDLWDDTPNPARDARRLRFFGRYRDVSVVVLDPDAVAGWSPVLAGAGFGPPLNVGGLAIYKVPARWRTLARRAAQGTS